MSHYSETYEEMYKDEYSKEFKASEYRERLAAELLPGEMIKIMFDDYLKKKK